MIIAKNSRSVVWEMSTMLASASASTAATAAMMPTLSTPITVTMTRLDFSCMLIPTAGTARSVSPRRGSSGL